MVVFVVGRERVVLVERRKECGNLGEKGHIEGQRTSLPANFSPSYGL